MPVRLPIGEFSRMTYLSIRALRFYHEAGILVPATIDPASGYRYYAPSQVPVAQVIRRLRDLRMPLEEIGAVVAAPAVTDRNAAIVAHLARMQEQLAATQATVASLQALLERPAGPLAVEHRSVPATRALAIGGEVSMTGIGDWWAGAFAELDDVLQRQEIRRAGLPGALYPREFFEEEEGKVIAFVPVEERTAVAGRGRALVQLVPAAELAVAVHEGEFTDLDRTYGALGTYVAEREIGVDGPIREYYALTAAGGTDGAGSVGAGADGAEQRTEVCWPVFHTRPASEETNTETKPATNPRKGHNR
jgi:DNA-binding transcriptional MerR regulator